jgi:hypothetical protein
LSGKIRLIGNKIEVRLQPVLQGKPWTGRFLLDTRIILTNIMFISLTFSSCYSNNHLSAEGELYENLNDSKKGKKYTFG